MKRIICQILVLIAVPICETAFASSRWAGDLSPIPQSEWNRAYAAHLIERAGFGGTPQDIATLAALTPREAVRRLVYFENAPTVELPPFDASGVFDDGLEGFPASRPAATDLAKANGEALGVKVKSGGSRPVQPVVNKFFYWLRASRLETHRIAYWWANRMLISPRPFQEKMALFWHGHFATSEEKVRDYRKMLKQLELFHRAGRGSFRDLLISVAQDPAMLAFLDAGINVKGAPNENFAREIMELFAMGVGNYSERDIREAARAFTGWNFRVLEFHFDAAKHDDGQKTIFGEVGQFDGVAAIDLILKQPVTAEYIGTKLYSFFVRTDPEPPLRRQLGNLLREKHYDIASFMEALFMSKDFYAPETIGSRIKGPVELIVSTYRKLGLRDVPGVPDFNELSSALGQRLMYPPTVAGWAGGRDWITPGQLILRGNFAIDITFPDIGFIPGDRYPIHATGNELRAVQERARAGMEMADATKPADKDGNPETMSAANRNVGRDEQFNTRFGTYRGWQMAIERVKPIPRTVPHFDLMRMLLEAGITSVPDAVSYLERRFLSVQLDTATRAELASFLTQELGTSDLVAAATYAEEALRLTLHLLLSQPEYQLG